MVQWGYFGAPLGTSATEQLHCTILGPRGMPEATQQRLNRAAMEAMAEPELRRRLTLAGIDPAEPSTPASTRDFVAAELAKFQAIVRETGLRLGRG